MKTNTQKVLRRIKVLLQAIALRRKLPMHYNSLMICINWMPQFVGEKVDYQLNDLDSDHMMDLFVKIVGKYLRKFPPEKNISKQFIAGFIASLDSSLVETRETPISFAEKVFLEHYDPLTDGEGVYFA